MALVSISVIYALPRAISGVHFRAAKTSLVPVGASSSVRKGAYTLNDSFSSIFWKSIRNPSYLRHLETLRLIFNQFHARSINVANAGTKIPCGIFVAYHLLRHAIHFNVRRW